MLYEYMHTLESQLRPFDPKSEQDLEHFRMLRFEGKQGKRRYILESPFPDVMSMMLHKISVEYLKNTIGDFDQRY